MADNRPIPTPWREHLRELRMQVLPLAVWLGGWAVVAVLWMATPKESPLVGLGLGEEILVASPEAGWIEELHVDLFDEVAPGQLLVTLSSDALDADLIEATAELARLQAELTAQRAALEVADAQVRQEIADGLATAEQEAAWDRARRLRSFLVEEQDAQIAALEATLARVDIELERDRVQVQLERAQGLLEESVGSEAEVEDLQAELAQLVGQAEAARRVEDRQLQAVAQTRVWREEFEALDPGLLARTVLDPRIEEQVAGLEAALAVQRARMASLEARASGLIVRAPRAGRVAALDAHVGQQVLAAQAMLRLERPVARGVLVYLPEVDATEVAIGDRVQIRRGLEEGEARVLGVSPGLEALPTRLWLDPRIAEYGRVLRLGEPVGLQLVPGERVGALVRRDSQPEG